MRVKTDIGEKTIRFSWSENLSNFRGNIFYITYDVDVSQTPVHLANFMFVMIMIDALIWCKKPIVLSELTLKEKECLEKNILMSHRSGGCCGRLLGLPSPKLDSAPPKLSALKIVDGDEAEGGGPVLISNGMGKDALVSISMVKEMGFEPHPFMVRKRVNDNPLWRERLATANEVYTIKNLDSNIILTNSRAIKPRIRNFGFYPYFYGYPLAYAYNSDTILGATEIHNSKVHAKTFDVACGGESIFTADYVSKATGIRFSSPTRALTEYGSQKVFSERYPELAHFQRSCERGLPWCKRCSKCYRTSLNLTVAGFDPTKIGLKPYERGSLLTNPHPRSKRTDSSVELKRFGNSHLKWVFGANTHVLDLIWQGRKIRKIVSEHLPLYDYDPGLDEGGYVLAPSKWEKWLKRGIVYYMENQHG